MTSKVFPPNLQMQAHQQQNMTQRMIMSSHMQQALHLLQLPLIELENFIEEQVVQNPILEIGDEIKSDEFEDSDFSEERGENEEIVISDRDLSILSRLEDDWREHFASDTVPIKRSNEEDKLKTYQENSICAPVNLNTFLNQQAHETFDNEKDLEIARIIIGYIDSFGFLKTEKNEICLFHAIQDSDYARILQEIRSFEPYGVGASSIQDALLIQLHCLGKNNTLAYKIIENHYNDLIHNHLPQIQKCLKCTFKELHHAIEKDIAKLDLHPGTHYSHQPIQAIIPDVNLRLENEKLIVEIESEHVPNLKLNHRYLNMLQNEETSGEIKQFIKRHLFSAKWLMRNLNQRYSTIERIAQVLAEKQYEFFTNPHGQLLPLTMKTVAEELNLHESTIARTVSNKYINSPRGIFPLRSFFTSKYVSNEGDTLSSQTVKDAIFTIIGSEDKTHPLSDAKISDLLNQQGIPCARRTVAKYRLAFQIGNTQQRKKFK